MALTKLDPNVIGQDSTGTGKITSAGGSVSIDSSGNVRIANASANSVLFAANGFVGIGTATPGQDFVLQSSSSGQTLLNIINTSTGGYSWNIGTVGSAAGLAPVGSFVVRDSTNGANRLLIAANGNFGIACNAPTYALTVGGSAFTSTSVVSGTNGIITGTNLNSLILPGSYMGYNLTNAPTVASTAWVNVVVTSNGSDQIYQTAYPAQYISKTAWIRHSFDGGSTWNSWIRASGAGSIIQVQYSAPTNLGAVSRSSSTWGEISSSWRVSITPSSSSSILRITCHFCFDTTGANSYLDHFKFYDVTNSAEVLIGDANGSRTRCLMASRGAAYDPNDPVWMSFTAIIPAGSTNARTYGVYHKVESGTPARTFFGSSLTSTAGWQTAPVFFVEEIAQ